MKALVAAGIALTVAAVAAANPGDPKKVIVPAVQAKAKAINVQLSDLPRSAGWKVQPSSSSGSVPRCSYYQPDQSDLTENGDADSPEFTLPGNSDSYVSSTTGIFVSAKQAATAYARVVQPKLPRCLAQIFKSGVPKGYSVTILSAAPMQFPKIAPTTDAYRIHASIKVGKQTLPTYLDLVVMNVGKVDVVIFFAGINFVFNSSFEQGVARAVEARAATA